MIKTIILAVCFLSICFVGVFISKHYKKRAEFFKDFQKYLTIAIEGIRNTKLSKEEIKERAKKQTSADFGAYLSENTIPNYIKKQESADIESFFFSFGGNDLESTMELLQNKKTEVEGKVDECEKQLKSKGGLIMKLCILGGIALVIILI